MPTCPVCKNQGTLYIVDYENRDDKMTREIKKSQDVVKKEVRSTYACKACLGNEGLGEMTWPPPAETGYKKASNQ